MYCPIRLRPVLFVLLFLPTFLPSAYSDVILEVNDDGSDLTLTWTGSIDVGAPATTTPIIDDADFYTPRSNAISSLDGSSFQVRDIGVISGNDPYLSRFAVSSPSNGNGLGFGFVGDDLAWDDSFGAAPRVINPTRSWTITSETVATAFGSNLDSGPVLLWTHNVNGDTISVALAASAVPEPASTMILVTGALGLLGFRRRKRHQMV